MCNDKTRNGLVIGICLFAQVFIWFGAHALKMLISECHSPLDPVWLRPDREGGRHLTAHQFHSKSTTFIVRCDGRTLLLFLLLVLLLLIILFVFLLLSLSTATSSPPTHSSSPWCLKCFRRPRLSVSNVLSVLALVLQVLQVYSP